MIQWRSFFYNGALKPRIYLNNKSPRFWTNLIVSDRAQPWQNSLLLSLASRTLRKCPSHPWTHLRERSPGLLSVSQYRPLNHRSIVRQGGRVSILFDFLIFDFLKCHSYFNKHSSFVIKGMFSSDSNVAYLSLWDYSFPLPWVQRSPNISPLPAASHQAPPDSRVGNNLIPFSIKSSHLAVPSTQNVRQDWLLVTDSTF